MFNKIFFLSGLVFVIIYSNFALADDVVTNKDISIPVEKDVAEYESLLNQKYSLFIHKRNYLLPFSYVWNPSEELYDAATAGAPADRGDYYRKQEAEFQISFFFPAYRKPFKFQGDILLAYTHHSWWQIYNTDWSKPFRETNYNPELFYRNVGSSLGKVFGLDVVVYDFGYMHQSNGQIQELSRSWDRLFFRTLLTDSSFSVILTAWMRIPERPGKDDNTDIVGYMGLGEVELKKTFGKLTLESKIPLARAPGVELNVSYPWEDNFRWFISGRTGYGHSLIEYDRDTSRLGIGITLESFLDSKN